MLNLLAGNEALALGACHAGVMVASAYPGTPSTEILEALSAHKEIRTDWASDERVAMEVALGASFAGAPKRSRIHALDSSRPTTTSSAAPSFVRRPTPRARGSLTARSERGNGKRPSEPPAEGAGSGTKGAPDPEEEPLLLVFGLISASYLVRLDINQAERDAAIAEALPVYQDIGTSLILPLSENQLVSLNARGWPVEVLDTDLSPGDYFIIHKAGLGAGSVPVRVLWENDRLRIVRLPELDSRALKAAGFPHPLHHRSPDVFHGKSLLLVLHK